LGVGAGSVTRSWAICSSARASQSDWCSGAIGSLVSSSLLPWP